MPTPPPNQTAAAWLAGKTIADLAAFEHAGRLYIPDGLRWLGPKGEEDFRPYAFVVPTEHERALARVEAIRLVAALKGAKDMMGPPTDWSVDRARAVIGADVFENYDTACIVSYGVRELAEPHGRAYLPEILISSYVPSVIFDAFERLDFYSKVYNPRLEELSEEDFWKAVSGVARAKNLGPLAVMRGSAQVSFVTRMAAILSTSPREPS